MTIPVLADIREERNRQDDTWGVDTITPDGIMLSVLVEEVGEVARAMQDDGNLYTELIQVAAVAQRWASMVYRSKKEPPHD